MTCNKCGAEFSENSKFCTSCGSPALTAEPQPAAEPQQVYQQPVQPQAPQYQQSQQVQYQQPQQAQYQQPQQAQYHQPGYPPPPQGYAGTAVKKPVNKGLIIGIALAVVAVVIIGAFLIVLFSGSGGSRTYEDLLSDYFDAYSNGATDRIYNMFSPVIREIFEKEYDEYYEELSEFLDDSIDIKELFVTEMIYRSGSLGEPIDEWEIRNVSELASFEIEDIIREAYDEGYSFSPREIVDVEVRVLFANGGEYYYDFTLTREGSRWYIISSW